MFAFLTNLRSRETRPEPAQDEDRLAVALVNEARSDSQRLRIVEQARRRAAALR